MGIFDTLVRFFQGGGSFMFPIALVLAVGLAIAIERWLFLQTAEAKNSALWKRVTPLIRDRNFDAISAEASRSKAVLASVLTYGIARARTTRSREEVEVAMDESMMEVLPRLEKRTHYLATFANVSTLLGLLGTVVGLIHAFAAVSGVSPAEKAALLSSAISEAMNCTAFGLITAIPLMLVHSWLTSKATEIEDSLEMASVKFLNALTEAPAAGR
jgi:biopolymer transport protein ExbB/TolQ